MRAGGGAAGASTPTEVALLEVDAAEEEVQANVLHCTVLYGTELN